MTGSIPFVIAINQKVIKEMKKKDRREVQNNTQKYIQSLNNWINASEQQSQLGLSSPGELYKIEVALLATLPDKHLTKARPQYIVLFYASYTLLAEKRLRPQLIANGFLQPTYPSFRVQHPPQIHSILLDPTRTMKASKTTLWWHIQNTGFRIGEPVWVFLLKNH